MADASTRSHVVAILIVAALLLLLAFSGYIMSTHVDKFIVPPTGTVCANSATAPIGMYSISADSCYLHKDHKLVKNNCNMQNNNLKGDGTLVDDIQMVAGTDNCLVKFKTPVSENKVQVEEYLKKLAALDGGARNQFEKDYTTALKNLDSANNDRDKAIRDLENAQREKNNKESEWAQTSTEKTNVMSDNEKITNKFQSEIPSKKIKYTKSLGIAGIVNPPPPEELISDVDVQVKKVDSYQQVIVKNTTDKVTQWGCLNTLYYVNVKTDSRFIQLTLPRVINVDTINEVNVSGMSAVVKDGVGNTLFQGNTTALNNGWYYITYDTNSNITKNIVITFALNVSYVQLFKDENYGGEYARVFSYSPNISSSIHDSWNKNVSSIKVAPFTRVLLYDTENYNGIPYEISNNTLAWQNIPSLARVWKDNALISLRVSTLK